MRQSRRHILLLEESRDVSLAFDTLLQRHYGYALHWVTNTREAIGTAGRKNVDVAVVDLAHGAEISNRLNMIRSWRDGGDAFPVIATSAHDYDGLGVEALSAGADDYVRKPFRFSEMVARIERQLARERVPPSRLPKIDGMQLPPAAFEFAGAIIHPDLRVSFPDGTAAQLTPKQVGILQEFTRHAGALVLRNALIHAVWGADANTNSKSVDQYLSVLRRTFREAGIDLSAMITPVLRVGWRIAAEVGAKRSLVASK